MSLQNQTIFWSALPSGEGWDGFSLLVDDVERYVGVALNYSLASLQVDIPHFFRIAVRSILDLHRAFSSRVRPLAVYRFRGSGGLYDACDSMAKRDMDGPTPRPFMNSLLLEYL